jgi:hypothetical protein
MLTIISVGKHNALSGNTPPLGTRGPIPAASTKRPFQPQDIMFAVLCKNIKGAVQATIVPCVNRVLIRVTLPLGLGWQILWC